MDVITESELAKHHEVHNLWVSIRGKVYDVSSYVDDHPGGVEVLKDVAGSDGTESFEYVGHSEDAYKTLAKFQIGVLEGECFIETKGGWMARSSDISAGCGNWQSVVAPKSASV
ncbi:Cytochrome b5 [Colletotrichum gloeosporioides]|uniref:Cytochrome b5 n=1 Tax=Colletotrichum gloeosporioides TaxID=474922 RepID=A0A8H4C7X8_COLGL|nr:Cytochrome b5 [Colletotrichum gloeosporioides]KAF3798811.1 Cytochrome b5 [Colletotrichum gloeosporioides]